MEGLQVGFIEEFQHRLRNVNRSARIALAAETAARVVPVYEDTDAPEIDQAVELAWSAATGCEVSEADRQSCATALENLLDTLADDDSLAYDVALVVDNTLGSIAVDGDEQSAAVARVFAVAECVAELAELRANDWSPEDQQIEAALAEERLWQDQAIDVAVASQGPVTRDMFVGLGTTPRWLVNWRTRTAGHR